jgi:hypothetical protein
MSMDEIEKKQQIKFDALKKIKIKFDKINKKPLFLNFSKANVFFKANKREKRTRQKTPIELYCEKDYETFLMSL